MASRVSFTRVEVSLDPRPRLGEWRRQLAHAVDDAPSRKLLIWRAFWLPYWLGSDNPAPQLPARNEPAPAGGPAGDQVVHMLDQIARRVWTQRALNVIARALWLGLLVAFFWLLIDLSGGPNLELPWLIGVWAVFIFPGLVLAALSRPTRGRVARMLDRSFHLHERMSTSLGNLGRDLPVPNQRTSVVYLQVADSANVATELREHQAFKVHLPTREIVAAIACALLLASLFFLRGTSGEVPKVADSPVPRFVPATERYAKQEANAAAAPATNENAPSTAEVEAKAQRSQEARRDLQQLAQALDDHAVTRSAAEAIQRGDYQAAANDLRDLAQNADQLSPEARQGLADDLDKAAQEMSPGSKDLANAASEAADGLRQGGEPAKEGVDQLGDAVDKTGQQVVSQQELADQMQQAQAAQASGQQSQQSGSQDQASSGEQAAADAAAAAQAQLHNQTGQPADQGQGADAQPGEGQQDQSGQQDQQGPTQGKEQPGAQSQDGPPNSGSQGAQGEQQSGDSRQPGTSPGQSPGDTPSEGDQTLNSQTDTGDQSQKGGGAGSGDNPDQQNSGDSGQNGDSKSSNEKPPSADVTDEKAAEGSGQDPSQEQRDAVTLSRSPDGEGVTTSGDSGTSSLGSGSGVSVSGGSSVQGDVGQAGPDSNRVPPAYRSLVESFFSDSDGS
jgi:hypothetical protein